MVELWITYLLPAFIINKLGPISMIVAGFLVEKHYIGRISIFLNTIAINVYSYYQLSNLTIFDIWYCNIGLIIGLIALISYAFKESLSSLYYVIAIPYCSVITGFYILFR